MIRCSRIVLTQAALLGALGVSSAPAATLTVADMDAADWTRTVLTDTGNASLATRVETRPGDPTDTFWLTEWALPAPTQPGTSSDSFAHVFQPFAWDPGVDGAVDRFDFSLEGVRLASTLASGIAGFVRPVVEQAGSLFIVLGSALSLESPLQFTTLTWQFEDTDAWTRVGGGAAPDFSATGGALRFGYRWELATTCTGAAGCRGASTSASIDNFQATVTRQQVGPPSSVPEPGMVWLLVVAAVAAGCAGRPRPSLPGPGPA